jgi:cytochrome c oxidase assembly protein subunit 15
MDFREAFILWRGLGINYEFGVLDAPARAAIHFIHRVGALVTSIVVLALALVCWRSRSPALVRAGVILVLVLATQVSLGIANVISGLPLPMAVAHNGGAALLLLTVATVLYFASRPTASAIPRN